MKAMIFAAGLGTRLKPITDTLPKALVPVCGMPLIEHVARRLKSSGIDEAVVNVHHFADKVETWVAGQDIMTMNVSDERQMLLETGGAVLNARRYLEGCGHFLIHNVDILSDVDLGWFMSQARPDALATLLVSDRKSSRYLLFDPETMRLVGWKNENTGEIRPSGILIDEDRCVKLAFSGIHIMSDKVFEAMEGYPERFPVIDFYLDKCLSYEIYGVRAENLNLIDVGKLDTLEQAEKFLKP
jgi:NDP-sugar pyrophosphorylase family protein